MVYMQMKQNQPNGTFTHYFTTISIQHQNNCQTSIFKFFIKKYIFNPNHIKFFKNQKSNITTQTPIQKTTFHQYTSVTKFLYFLRYGAITSIPYIFHTSKFDLFDQKNPKIQSSWNPSWHTIPNLNWTERAKKIQHWFSLWPWHRCRHTFLRPCL